MPVSERLVSALRDAVRPGLTRDELSRSWRPCFTPTGKRESGGVEFSLALVAFELLVSWRQPAWRVVLCCAGVGGLPLA